MRFGLASSPPPPPPLPPPINLAVDDKDTEEEEGDDDLEPPRWEALPRPRSTRRSPGPSTSRKRSLEQVSVSRDAASSSDDSEAERRPAPHVSSLEAAELSAHEGERSARDRDRDRGRFLAPSPVHIARRKKRGLHFFMDDASRQNALHGRQQAGSAAETDPTSVSAPRSLICGQQFGRCRLRFGADQVDLLLWRPASASGETCAWKGAVKYAQLARFCLSSGERAPYLLLLEIEASAKGYTPFAQLFDPLFARWSQDHADASDSHLYGAVLVFDEELDYARCRSIGESIAELRGFFQQTIPQEETKWYRKLDRRSQQDKESDRRVWRQEALPLSNGVAAPRSASTSPDLPPADAQLSPQRDRLMDTRGLATDDPPVNRSEESKESQSEAPGVIVLQTQDSASSTDVSVAQKSAAAADPRHQVALLYPYEESEALGRVSVTFGDIKRLAPGEFLNDNLIDFYLRFLWRHCEPWQQQQTYFFTSHFFTQLKPPRDKKLTAQERYARVARWTLKETDLLNKRFLFIPINDSFHWSIAVLCNPGSAIVTKRRRRIPRQRRDGSSAEATDGMEVIDVEADPFHYFREAEMQDSMMATTGFSRATVGKARDGSEAREEAEFVEEELEESWRRRREYPPCVLFLDSLRCHRKKKFSTMLREYLECEWAARMSPPSDPEPKAESAATAGPDGTIDQPATVDDEDEDEEEDVETIVTSFDVDSIGLIEPDIPRQSNSSDCGVFLLMYAAEVVRRFPAGATREDLETNLSSTLTPNMFAAEHVREFRDYVHQLIFCLRALEKRGLSESHVKDEQLEWFTIDT